MSKLLAKIKGQTTHKPASSEPDNHPTDDREVHDQNSKDFESEAPPKGAQPPGPLMSYDSTDRPSGACFARGGKKSDGSLEEQQFTIQPHPAKTNDPRDLTGDEGQDFMSPGGGACSARNPFNAFNAPPGPVIPNAAHQQEIPPPSSRDELRVRSAELNQAAGDKKEDSQ